jgi:hypothetical protein
MSKGSISVTDTSLSTNSDVKELCRRDFAHESTTLVVDGNSISTTSELMSSSIEWKSLRHVQRTQLATLATWIRLSRRRSHRSSRIVASCEGTDASVKKNISKRSRPDSCVNAVRYAGSSRLHRSSMHGLLGDKRHQYDTVDHSHRFHRHPHLTSSPIWQSQPH